MPKMSRILLCVLFLCPLMTGVTRAERGTSSAMLVPARHTVLQLAFDAARLRPSMALVAYAADADAEEPKLYVWGRATRSWSPLNFSDYASGTVFSSTPRTVLLVGRDVDLPEALSAGPGWAENVVRVPALDAVSIVNALKGALRLRSTEMRWLAGRYDLKMADRNAERRRWGRYGPRGGRPRVDMPGDDEAMPGPVPVPGVREAAVPEAAPAVAAPEPEKGVPVPADPAPMPEVVEPDVDAEALMPVPDEGIDASVPTYQDPIIREIPPEDK